MTKTKKIIITLLAVVLTFMTAACSSDLQDLYSFVSGDDYISKIEDGATLIEDIDVGQGDSYLISNSGFGNILIDTGDTEHKDTLVSHLKKRGIKKIDYVILTHPHSDHIGGMTGVLDNFQVGNIYMPKMTHNTATFKKMINKVKEKNLYFKEAKSGVKISLGKGSSINFLSPTKDMSLKDLDNSDAVCMLKTNGRKVLFTGDIFKETEIKLIPRIGRIDILKVAHHGSHKATCKELLMASKPTYAMIGVGEDNKYDHPSKSALNRLDKYNVKVYRTDLSGNIGFTINNDGSIKVDTSR